MRFSSPALSGEALGALIAGQPPPIAWAAVEALAGLALVLQPCYTLVDLVNQVGGQMAGPMGRFRYLDDNDNPFVIRMDASNAALVGAANSDGTEPAKPSGLKPRYVLAQLPNGRQRRIIVTDRASGAWTGSTASVTLPDFGNGMAPVTAQLRGRVGERRYAR